MKLLKNFKTRDWLAIMISIALIVTQVYLDLWLPDFTKEITLLVQQGTGSVSQIWEVGFTMLLIALGSGLSSIIVGFFVARVAIRFSQNIRKSLYRHVLSFSSAEINKFSTASLITRTTNDTTQIQRFVAMGLQVFIKAPILATWAILKIVNKSWEWSLVTAISVMLLLIVISVLVVFVVPKFKVVQSLTDSLNGTARENLTGTRVIRAYNAEEYREQKFETVNEKLTSTNLFINRLMAIINPMMILIMNGIVLSIYWVGAYIINKANLLNKLSLFGDMVIFASYAMQVIFAFVMLIMLFIMLPRVLVSIKRIVEVLNTKPTITSGNKTPQKNRKKAFIELKNVSFKYPGAEDSVLNNINIKIDKGQTVAFIGSTGSGKSTLIHLITRFYDATEGKVLIDGIDIKDYDLQQLYNKIGYVSQKSVIFSGDIEHNINFGNNKDINNNMDIDKASSIAQASEFIDNLDKRYKSNIAEGGTNLSGGQKQRVSIARAIHRNPQIYVFDDSFSALDYKTDYVLRKELKEKTANATKLIVAQRIGTIKNADKIVVLDQGGIVGIGKHEELLANCKVYKEIAQSQLSKKELTNGNK